MNWGELRTNVKHRLGLGTGTTYDTRVDIAMEMAGVLLHSVKWNAIYDNSEYLTKVIIGATECTDTPADLGIIDERSFYIIPYLRLIRGDERNILFAPPAAQGRPLHYIQRNGKIHVGCPTADQTYYMRYGYWRCWATPASDTDTPEIVTALGDGLFTAAAVWQFAKYFELEEDQPVTSEQALSELIMFAKLAEKRCGYIGPSLEDIIKSQPAG